MKPALVGSEADDGAVAAWSWTNERGDAVLIEWDVDGTFEPAPKTRMIAKPIQSRGIEKPKVPRAVRVSPERREVVVPKEGRKP